jgi:hypothetical protein
VVRDPDAMAVPNSNKTVAGYSPDILSID